MDPVGDVRTDEPDRQRYHRPRDTTRGQQGDEDGELEDVTAPGVVLHERGVVHGARNDTDETVVFTASLCPLPS